MRLTFPLKAPSRDRETALLLLLRFSSMRYTVTVTRSIVNKEKPHCQSRI